MDIDLNVEEVGELLTDTGLEVEGIDQVESIPGGLEGLVIGEVLTIEKHPDADRLNVTTVSIGNGEPLSIVCGAPNVDAGQKVVIATVGTVLHPTEGESFKIKRSKIRGIESSGMICAEDEIGLGSEHDGIMVLKEDAKVGMLARDYFELENDSVFEIGLTPNRADAMSHIGTARDLSAALQLHKPDVNAFVNWPSVEDFKVDNTSRTIEVEVKDAAACPRYASLSISGVKVGPSPEGLQKRLKAIGLKPINNIVDATNFVLHELGHPMHAFDADQIDGGKVIVQQLAQGTKFVTLDDEERELSSEDLMICNANGGMCIAGVFGGAKSGVTDATTNIFLESAYFNPVSVRKTAKRHVLNTDASFRYERGVDPNLSIIALKRCAMLIKANAGGEISSEISDFYPEPIQPFTVEFSYVNCDKLLGKQIDHDTIKKILVSLDIEVKAETTEQLTLSVPAYRVDVQREADVIEEILRIYGFNSIDIPEKQTASLSYRQKPDLEVVQHLISDQLSSNGFSEIMSNSLTSSRYAEIADASQMKAEFNVEILNPLSSELGVMRQTLLFSGLEAIAHNQNRQRLDLSLYEFGNIYQQFPDGRKEGKRLAIFLCGRKDAEQWNTSDDAVSFYGLKGYVNSILQRLGIFKNMKVGATKSELFDDGMSYTIAKKKVVDFGWVKSSILKKMDVKQEVFFADFDWSAVAELLKMNRVKYKAIPKFPAVRRDLSLLLDEMVKFAQIEELAFQQERKLLKEVGLFDVYQGKNLGEGKKSYAVSFVIQDDNQTLTDKQIDKIMDKIQGTFEQQLGAQLR
jgi:phenylalanyl-tRNA synthetase beta chain